MAKKSSKQKVCYECPQEKEPIKIRVSFFFDGTKNNAGNVRARTPGEGGSYASDLTNVVRLFDALSTRSDEFDHHFKIYTEGVGTITGEGDHIWDSATGKGDAGVEAKAEAGWQSALEEMKGKGISTSADIDITFDVFGFSRGAACARYFIHVFRIDKEGFRSMPAKNMGYQKISQPKCKYAGLFDTVASFGLDHSDDTAQLHLDAVKFAETGLHLCAAEEHRENFRLTNTNSNSNIDQFFLPGVHSDIGGGYVDNSNEEDWEVYESSFPSFPSTREEAIEQEMKWLTDRGWYKRSEMETDWNYEYIMATRKNIRNQYTYIPMNMMAKHSTDNGSIKYRASEIRSYGIPPDLNFLKTKLYAYLDSCSDDDWMNNTTKEMQEIRHKYFHFSSRYNGIGHDPQWSNDNQRQRIIQDG